ncbi:MAG: hypothetical protein H6604_03345 [Flavobacteriales bacterium]|nr:hypothetical protein [Flavobacteriales bacterium]
MRKYGIAVLFLMISFSAYAQEGEKSKIAQMPLYKGCEEYKKNKKDALQCFSNSLSQDMVDYIITPDVNPKEIEYFEDKMKIIINFIINKEGKIEDLKFSPKHTKAEFKQSIIDAIDKLNSKRKIKPGLNSEGEKVTMSYTFPVNFKYDRDAFSEKEKQFIDEKTLLYPKVSECIILDLNYQSSYNCIKDFINENISEIELPRTFYENEENPSIELGFYIDEQGLFKVYEIEGIKQEKYAFAMTLLSEKLDKINQEYFGKIQPARTQNGKYIKYLYSMMLDKVKVKPE